MYDLNRNGFDVVGEEVMMKVNGARIKADIVARDAKGNLHIFEVKRATSKLTKNQVASGVFDMTKHSNTATGVGGGKIRPSMGTKANFKPAT